MRSSALVARGLRDLARDSNWLIKKIFTGHSPHLAISSTGQVCAISTHIHHGASQVALYDLELSVPTMALSVPDAGRGIRASENLPGAIRGRPKRDIWSARGADGHLDFIFSICTETLSRQVWNWNIECATVPGNLAWSDSGSYFVATSRGRHASLRLWEPKAAPRRRRSRQESARRIGSNRSRPARSLPKKVIHRIWTRRVQPE